MDFSGSFVCFDERNTWSETQPLFSGLTPFSALFCSVATTNLAGHEFQSRPVSFTPTAIYTPEYTKATGHQLRSRSLRFSEAVPSRALGLHPPN